MKYILLASLISSFSFNSFALGERSKGDCCQTNTNCGGKPNCDGTAFPRNFDVSEKKAPVKKPKKRGNKTNAVGA